MPSAGSRHPFETWLLIDRVAGNAGLLPPGLDRYLAVEHKLTEVDARPGLAEEMVAACGGQEKAIPEWNFPEQSPRGTLGDRLPVRYSPAPLEVLTWT